MLSLEIPERELWDERTETFVYAIGGTLRLEHSLLALSKWESRWKKPFLSTEKTREEMRDYVRCMTLNRADPTTYHALTDAMYRRIAAYIDDPMTATTFSGTAGGLRGGGIQTAETIYWQMVQFGVPFTCERWHLNKLLTLLRVCGEKNAPTQKMGRAEQARYNSALNASRRKAMRSRG